MSFPNVLDANEPTIVRIVRNIARAEFAEFWRELVRPVTLFDLCRCGNLLDREIGEFSRKWCARRDSNAGPPA